MQITDHSKEQILLGVQGLRTMASSAGTNMISPQGTTSLSVATELSMSISSSAKPVRASQGPPAMQQQLELLPLYPSSSSMMRSQQQPSSNSTKLFFSRGQYENMMPSLMQSSRGGPDMCVNHSVLQAHVGVHPSNMGVLPSNMGTHPSHMSSHPSFMQSSMPLHPSAMPPTCKGADSSHTSSMHVIPHTHRGVDIDVNQVPSSSDSDDEEEGGYPSLQLSESNNNHCMQRGGFSAMEGSPVSLKREREKVGSENNNNSNNMYEVSSRASDEEEGASTRKKLRLSKEQSALLEESFKEHSTLNPKQKNALAKQLNLRPRQVEVWFQNRRARTKLKQTEVDCELLKRCCESLTEENRRLQKEVQELRALKVGAPCVIAHDFYMPLPAATLTMCPSCERLATLDGVSRPSKQHLPPSLAFSPHTPQPSAAC